MDLEFFKKMLLQKQDELKQLSETSKAGRRPVELDQTSVGRLSRMDAIQVQAMALAQQRQRQATLAAIEGALQRIKNNTYGDCTHCGEEISEARLRVSPTVTTCIICAKEISK